MYMMSNTSTERKKKLLDCLSDGLRLNLKVKIINNEYSYSLYLLPTAALTDCEATTRDCLSWNQSESNEQLNGLKTVNKNQYGSMFPEGWLLENAVYQVGNIIPDMLLYIFLSVLIFSRL